MEPRIPTKKKDMGRWIENRIMSKNVYIGVGGVARKVKNIYIGVGGVARKVKKGYIGVGGVARLFYQYKGRLDYDPNSPSFSSPYENMAATSIGNYALFGGGKTGKNSVTYSSTVYTINASSTMGTTTSSLGAPKAYLAATVVGNYALFGGVMVIIIRKT